MGLEDLSWTPSTIHEYARKNASLSTQYVGWISIFEEELTLRIWAYRQTKKYGFELREVIRAATDEELALVRDMYLNPNTGWKVFYKPSQARVSNWYGYTYYSVQEEDFNIWFHAKMPGVYYEIINKEALKDTFFNYSGYARGDIIEYLKLWKKHPCVEYFGKVGLHPSKAIIKQIEKEKAFGKWIAKQDVEELRNALPQATLYAYKHNVNLADAREICYRKNQAIQAFKGQGPITKQLDKVKTYEYLEKNGISVHRYMDYATACINLGLDMKDTKNSFPKDFDRMHDLRTAQWGSKKKKTKAKEFKEAAKKYKEFRYDSTEYCVVIPEKISDLVREGSILHHCVGKMGYDTKMIKGHSFIAFIRKADAKNDPFVTVEYDLRTNKITQIYGEHDSKPEKKVLTFANKWERRVKKSYGTEKRLHMA